MSDRDWELYVEDNVLIADFSEGMPSDEAEYAKVNERFETLAKQDHVTAHLSNLQMEAALNNDVYEKAKEAAEVGMQYGITKWVIVSDGIKNMALSSQVSDIPDIETETADDFDAAMDWARE